MQCQALHSGFQQYTSMLAKCTSELLWQHGSFLMQEAAMRARAKQANLETKKANEILLGFKKLDKQRELEADAAIEGEPLMGCHDVVP